MDSEEYILVIDDEEIVRSQLRHTLESAGFAVLEGADGEEGMEEFRNHPEQITLVLLDLNMPKKDGREALEEIKADPKLRRIPIVVLTTSKAEEDILRTYDLGVNSFIIKPVMFESLVEIMKTLTKYWFEIVELPFDGVKV